MSSNNKKRLLSEITDDSTSNQPAKKRKMISDDNNKKIVGLDEEEDEEVVDTANTKIQSQLSHSGEPITLNVGGTKYQTSLHTLTSYQSTVLSKMFEGKFSLKPSKDGSYFIDRNGTYFGLILDYLRNGQIIIPQTERSYIISHLLMESQYYQIASLEKELRIMSIDSNMLSPQQIVNIQSMIYPNQEFEKHIFNWKLLYKYNIMENMCPRDAPSMLEDVVDVIKGRKSVLIVMMAQAAIWVIFVAKELKSYNTQITLSSPGIGIAFKLNSIHQTIDLSSFWIRKSGIAINDREHKRIFYMIPVTLEIFQL
eukprot:479851_1